MGALHHHNIQEYIENYKLSNYVETGTGMGECLQHALQFNFENLYSVEIYPKVFESVEKKFVDTKAKVLLGNSFEVLPEILKTLDGDVLFFLDAHFPGADFHYETYTSTADYDTRLPLEKELRTIKNNRDISKDVFIIDDLRVYEDNNYGDGNWPLRQQAGGDGISFIYEIFEHTHNVDRDLRYQGFLIITPK
jgi:hypothetical protein